MTFTRWQWAQFPLCNVIQTLYRFSCIWIGTTIARIRIHGALTVLGLLSMACETSKQSKSDRLYGEICLLSIQQDIQSDTR
jgi:hypothetical protein